VDGAAIIVTATEIACYRHDKSDRCEADPGVLH
jgi:hypothetical protein